MLGRRPIAFAAACVRVPTTSVDARRSGSLSPSMPAMPTRGSDQRRAVRSSTLVPEASEYSVAITPVSRKLSQSLACSIFAVRA
ncbi:MAG: hypothetical protein A2177_12405 [Spirochaetes bacterium RBG_13_68_11]|nr:MAG: hypothetical protein A2177_12405 [Spirochaetes bacterium RBG_13_68_11]